MASYFPDALEAIDSLGQECATQLKQPILNAERWICLYLCIINVHSAMKCMCPCRRLTRTAIIPADQPQRGIQVPIGTAVHERTFRLCQSLNFREWSGFYAVSVYETHHEHEYNAIRNAAALIDVT